MKRSEQLLLVEAGLWIGLTLIRVLVGQTTPTSDEVDRITDAFRKRFDPDDRNPQAL